MSRLPDLVYDKLTPAQQQMFATIAGSPAGMVTGPFSVWVLNPDLAERLRSVSALLRGQSTLAPPCYEIMTLVVARHWNSTYMWGVHELLALKAGLSREIVEAVKNRTPPPFNRDDVKLIYDVTKEIMDTKALSRITYDRALAAIGQDQLIELASVIGYYQMLAVTLVTFDVPAKPGDPALP